ncbi:hypothetical protein Acsp02_96950 [Actinoplanes sp. NBRC 103695]|nr:hypothetical protein Acsp02_96950 [Actinoplanes sp. NBRC 103695]
MQASGTLAQLALVLDEAFALIVFVEVVGPQIRQAKVQVSDGLDSMLIHLVWCPNSVVGTSRPPVPRQVDQHAADRTLTVQVNALSGHTSVAATTVRNAVPGPTDQRIGTRRPVVTRVRPRDDARRSSCRNQSGPLV